MSSNDAEIEEAYAVQDDAERGVSFSSKDLAIAERINTMLADMLAHPYSLRQTFTPGASAAQWDAEHAVDEA